MKKIAILVFATVLIAYLGLCVWFYQSQEKALFKSVKLAPDHQYTFDQKFEERYIAMPDGKKLNGVLFKADSSKGVIFWLPGGRGMLDSVGLDAKYYTDLNYDLFLINYRGFGKSEGKIESEEQFNADMQAVYNSLKTNYREDQTIIYGYSLGSGPAAHLAATNQPAQLILQAPYYSLTDMVKKKLPYLPVSALLNYEFPTFKYLTEVKSPVIIFHGTADKQIDIETSRKLKQLLKPSDELIALKDQGHNNFVNNPEYLRELARVLP